MEQDFLLALTGLIVGFIVGVTGMGGGALMTPILVILFRVHPLAAVSSDLVASVFMKPVGAAVHYRRGTVWREMVLWLVVGSVPSAFAGVIVLRLLGNGRDIQQVVQVALGLALIAAAVAIVVRASLQQRTESDRPAQPAAERVHKLPTIAVGVVGGLVVGMTSVGSGSLIIVALMLLYPRLSMARLVGTDLAQAIPLVASASLGHILYGDFQLGLTLPILVGAISGVFIGARTSAQAPSRIIRRAVLYVLIASGLKLLGLSAVELSVTLLVLAFTGELAWWLIRRFRIRSTRTKVESTTTSITA
jgi:uncharacterized membrane protein YfcA